MNHMTPPEPRWNYHSLREPMETPPRIISTDEFICETLGAGVDRFIVPLLCWPFRKLGSLVMRLWAWASRRL